MPKDVKRQPHDYQFDLQNRILWKISCSAPSRCLCLKENMSVSQENITRGCHYSDELYFQVLHSRAIHGKIANLQLHARISNPRWSCTLWGLAGIINSLSGGGGGGPLSCQFSTRPIRNIWYSNKINFTKACKVRTTCCCLSGGACTTLQDQKIRGPTLACQHSLLLTVIVRLYFVSFIPPLKDDMTTCHFYFYFFLALGLSQDTVEACD